MKLEPTGPAVRSGARRPSEDAIFQAALAAFGARGFNGSSMREIAQGANTSLSNLYNYVPAKADLLAWVLKHANDGLLAQLEGALASSTESAADRLSSVVRAYVGWSVAHRTAGLVAISEFRYLEGAQRKDVVAARDRTERIFTDVVQEGADSGEFATPFPHEAARNIVLLCSGLAAWYQPGRGRTASEIADEQARLALAMVEARLTPVTRRR
jgi:AcrR family transcriptional regulator